MATSGRYIYLSPIGPIVITSGERGITSIVITGTSHDGGVTYDRGDDDMCGTCEGDIGDCVAWLDTYFAGDFEKLERQKLPRMDLPDKGSFYNKVWACLRSIKPGTTVTYGELASLAGNSRAARAVGGAVRAHNYPLIIPCHRVVPASRGTGPSLGNYSAGNGCETKEWLLTHEKKYLCHD